MEELLYLISVVSFGLLNTFLFRLFRTQEDVITETKQKKRSRRKEIVCYHWSWYGAFPREMSQDQLDDLLRMYKQMDEWKLVVY